MTGARPTSEERRRRRDVSWLRMGVVLLTLSFFGVAALDVFRPTLVGWWQTTSWWLLAAAVASWLVPTVLGLAGVALLVRPLLRVGTVWTSGSLRAAGWVALACVGLRVPWLALDLAMSLGSSAAVPAVAYSQNWFLGFWSSLLGLTMVLGALGAIGMLRIAAWSRESRWVRWLGWVLGLWALHYALAAGVVALSWTRALPWDVASGADGASAWTLMVLAVATPAAGVVVCLRARFFFERPERWDVCRGCGYDLRGFESAACPECGVERRTTERSAAADDETAEGGDIERRVALGVVNARRMRRCARLISWGCCCLLGAVVLIVLSLVFVSAFATWDWQIGSTVWTILTSLQILAMLAAGLGGLILCVVAVLLWWPLRWFGRARPNVWLVRAAGFFLGVPLLLVTWAILAAIREGPNLVWLVGLLAGAGLWCCARAARLERARGDRARSVHAGLTLAAWVVLADVAFIVVSMILELWYIEPDWLMVVGIVMLCANFVVVVVGSFGERAVGAWVVGLGGEGENEPARAQAAD